jgi:phage/plasmid-like protein (TIGR03299 family)
MSHGIMQFDSMFSVREMPWHGLGSVLEDYPESIEEALLASGLEWPVESRPVYVGAPRVTTEGVVEGEFAPGFVAKEYRANVRKDTEEVLGIVSEDYQIVQNSEAFKFLDALIGSELHFETAGSLRNGRRVWVLARLPEFVEVGGDDVGTYVYVANSHDGSMAVTAAVSPIRIVCANTLGMALRRAEGRDAQRTFKFRHVGDLQLKFEEARSVMGLTVNYAERFKEVGDALASEKFAPWQMERVTRKLVGLDDDQLGDRARANRERQAEKIYSIYRGEGPEGDTRGNAPDTKWAAVNAIGEFADWERRYTKNTDQISRSFEDTDLKQRGLDLVLAE